ncbi:penicillin-binding transpeptidase domain-containing protein [Neobacillus notoginsengisoli]|uniref:serine-type D-Ala-D-Ala carboxypeptidase n=1 Tax=Neobacillus notoginsengisoli TaxID=1578198 RepID=A0A417YRH3_9BACI|nr:penicillin-binding transpeptidase domain-containing protein [Neobacillus notoginsengisoli]RHW37218.1 penicillin-binding transpeptidase domain-containing protein [Neobacillus notoginsengisoli]
MKRLMGIVMAAILVAALAGCTEKPQPADRFSRYIELWNKQEFDKMYDYLSKDAKASVSKKEFTERYKKIYGDLQIKNLKVSFKKPKEDKQAEGEEASYGFTAKMDSMAGSIEFGHDAYLVKEERDKEENWYVDWNTTYIFPQLGKGDKLSISTQQPVRGEIFDRNGNPLATTGLVYEVGIVPKDMEGQEAETKKQLSKLLNMPEESIEKAVTASWVKPEYFVPLKKVSMQEETLIAELIKLKPVQTKKVESRIYPYGKAAAHLIGYVGKATAEDLEKLKDKGYSSGDLIGKRGLEQVFEEQLRGEPGVQVLIDQEAGGQEVLAEKPVVDGQPVKLTVDADLQVKIMNAMKEEVGAAAAIHPKTGETLALVSMPTFDPNDAVFGMSAAEWKALNEHKDQPLNTRFNKKYAPGSVIKPLTAGVALTANAIDPAETMNVKGKQWQKDASWGGYFVTRVSDAANVNLEKALVLSDNIYFAQTALKLGKEKFAEGMKKLGFGDDFGYPFPLNASQTGGLDKDMLLADAGYGQAQLEMNIVHLAASYTPFLNNGNMLKPVLLLDDEKSQVLQEQAISPEAAATVGPILRKVVAGGTAKDAEIKGYPLSGKTGTAEVIKQAQGEKGKENGWFVAYNAEKGDLLVAMMVENVLDRGGSGIPVKMVKNIFEGVK